MQTENDTLYLLHSNHLENSEPLSVYQLTTIDCDIQSHPSEFGQEFNDVLKDLLYKLSLPYPTLSMVSFGSSLFEMEPYTPLSKKNGVNLFKQGMISMTRGINQELIEIFFQVKNSTNFNQFLCCCMISEESHIKFPMAQVRSAKEFERFKEQIEKTKPIMKFTTSDAWHYECNIEIDHSLFSYSDFLTKLQSICKKHNKKLEC